jgi:hypothetical protein
MFVCFNVIIYLFSIQYLGIHWFIDIIPGILLAIITSSFVHSVQPIIRARNENGWKSLLPNRKQTMASLLVMLICSSWLIFGVVDGSGTDENEANMRVGFGDINLDTIEVHSVWDPVTIDVSNVGENDIDLLLIKRGDVEEHVEKGIFSWDDFVSDGDLTLLERNNSIELTVNPESLFDVYLILVRLSESSDYEQGTLGEVRITPHYVDDELLWTGLLASLPAFIITGIVLEGMINFRRYQNKL